MKYFLIAILSLISINSFADFQKAQVITNDVDTNIVTMSVETVDGHFKSLRKVKTKSDNSLISDVSFTLEQLFKGSVVQIKGEREIIKIRFNRNFDTAYGGVFVLDYLFNGITNERRSIQYDLRKNGTKWEVTMNNKVANKLHVLANKNVMGTIGVKTIKSL